MAELFVLNPKRGDIYPLIKEMSKGNPATDLKDGFYFCDFLIADADTNRMSKGILRSLLRIKSTKDSKYFRRVTNVGEFYSATKSKPFENHIGLVTKVNDDIVFFGLNRARPHEPSILVAQPAFSPSIDFVGTAFTLGEHYLQSSFVLKNITGGLPIRSLFKQIGYMDGTKAEMLRNETAARRI